MYAFDSCSSSSLTPQYVGYLIAFSYGYWYSWDSVLTSASWLVIEWGLQEQMLTVYSPLPVTCSEKCSKNSLVSCFPQGSRCIWPFCSSPMAFWPSPPDWCNICFFPVTRDLPCLHAFYMTSDVRERGPCHAIAHLSVPLGSAGLMPWICMDQVLLHNFWRRHQLMAFLWTSLNPVYKNRSIFQVKTKTLCTSLLSVPGYTKSPTPFSKYPMFSEVSLLLFMEQ